MARETKKTGILFASFEAAPFMKTGGLGDVAGSLPKAVKKCGYDIRVVLPKLSVIPEKYRKKMEFVTEFHFPLSWRSVYCGLYTYTYKGVTYYFIDNEYYFKRDGIYGFFDDGERMAFFSKAVCEIIPHLIDFKCDILHANDWHTALVPVFLREAYVGDKDYANIKTVFTIHNLKFQGEMPDVVLGDIFGLEKSKTAKQNLKMNGNSVNCMKGALCYSDLITTVSPSYANEIKEPEYGERLEQIFQAKSDKLVGILNGIDTSFFNPECDKAIAANYSYDNLGGKELCKLELQKEFGLKEDKDIPLIIMIGRMTEQKGFDLVIRVIDEMLMEDLQIVILGTGDKKYEDYIRGVEERHNENMRAVIKFDEKLSHRMYAAADILLMPSEFEPCGLAQMIAMNYGCLPVVRETGGLKDSVKYYNKYTGEGTGFGFANYNAHEMLFAIKDITNLYKTDKKVWESLKVQAMKENFSWENAATEYGRLYESIS